MPEYKLKFKDLNKSPFALGYDDARIVSRHCKFLANEVDITSSLSDKIKLKQPFLSAAMDTVTESAMAIQMALNGGLGVIHKSLSPEQQVLEVKKVKRFESGFILDPLTVKPEDSIAKVVEIKNSLGYKSIPVTDDGKPNGKLVGMISDKDYSILKHDKTLVANRMTPLGELLTAPFGISLNEANDALLESKKGKLLLIDKQGYLRAMVTRTDIEKNNEYPLATKDKHKHLCVGAAIGGPGLDIDKRVPLLVENGTDVLFIDTAQAHSEGVRSAVKYLKDHLSSYPEVGWVVGNIDNTESAEFVFSTLEAQCAKVGIGPGSICTTANVTGAGIPQLTAVYECAQVARQYNGKIIADGGFGDDTGNIVKAFLAGADAIMSGSFFAGTEECPVVDKTKYRGMSSLDALLKGGSSRYYQENLKKEDLVVQGIEKKVEYKGPVSRQITKLANALKFSMAIHCGCKTIGELHSSGTEFVIKYRKPQNAR